jgi:hypothetical protein
MATFWNVSFPNGSMPGDLGRAPAVGLRAPEWAVVWCMFATCFNLQDGEISREAWFAAIPVVFVVAPSEVSTLQPPRPFYVRASHPPPAGCSCAWAQRNSRSRLPLFNACLVHRAGWG